jgi:WD40 repeat protein
MIPIGNYDFELLITCIEIVTLYNMVVLGTSCGSIKCFYNNFDQPKIFFGHRDKITSLKAFSPLYKTLEMASCKVCFTSAQHLISTSLDSELKIWDLGKSNSF